MRTRKCKTCGELFQQQRFGQVCCSPTCAITYATEQRKKKEAKKQLEQKRQERARIQARKNQLKTIRELADEVQKYCNRYIKLRDWGQPCISCGRPFKENFQACHYVPRGRSSKLRFDPDNIHGGCVRCNMYESGNLRGYRIGLINKIGAERVEELERDHGIKHWTRGDLEELKAHFKRLIKELENDAR